MGVEKKDRIEIRVKSRSLFSSALSSSRPQKRGIIKGSSVIQDQGRRRLISRPSSPGLLRFWDMGQQFNTSTHDWDNNEAYHQALFTLLPSSDPTHSSDQYEIESLTLAQQKVFDDALLTVPLANFETKFREVLKTFGSAFSLKATLHHDSGDTTFGYADTEWKDGGLLLPNSAFSDSPQIQVFIDTDLLPQQIKILDTSPTLSKITALPSYFSDEVPYSVKAGDNFFLMPATLLSSGGSSALLAPHVSVEVYLNTIYRGFPRSFPYTDQVWNTYEAGPTPSAGFLEAVTRHSALTGHRTVSINSVGENFPPATGWMERLSISYNADSFPVGYASTATAVFSPVSVPNELMGVVKRGTSAFYVWSR